MIPKFPVYLFDVDGTIMDSATDICAAQREVLTAAGFVGDLSDEFLRRFIGHHLIELFGSLGYPPEQHDAMVQHYRSIYLGRGHSDTRVYPGVGEMLARLDGRKSTATTKGTPTTRAVLEKFGLLHHFDHIQGTDGFPAKPEPDVLHASMQGLGVRPQDCLFIGDSAADMEAGRRAGVRTCAVRWGYGDFEAMAKWEPDFWIDSPEQLLR